MESGAMVETDALTKRFTNGDGDVVDAVKEVSLTIERGEIFSLLGPNGAGKTTLISMISGLLSPTAGDARIGGHSITAQPLAAKRLMGFVPQEIALYPELSARRNLLFFGKLYGLRGKALNLRVDELLDFIDLTDRQNEKIATYSGGMKRRVNIAVGLLHKPSLLYMDEPTVGIDPQNRRRILDTVRQLRDEDAMTILYTTHMMEEAAELSDRVAIIDHGEVIAQGTQSELTQQVEGEDRLEINLDGGGRSVDEIDALAAMMQREIDPIQSAVYTPAKTDEGGDVLPASGQLKLNVAHGRAALPTLLQWLNDHDVQVQSVRVHEPDLESVFLALTGRALRD